MPLTQLQLANVAVLAAFLETNVTDAQYDHTYIDTDEARCAAGHAYLNASLFTKTAEVPGTVRWYHKLFGITPAPKVKGENYVNEPQYESTFRTQESIFAKEAFGEDTWNNVFNGFAFDKRSSEVTRREVVNRLAAIARDGRYIEVLPEWNPEWNPEADTLAA